MLFFFEFKDGRLHPGKRFPARLKLAANGLWAWAKSPPAGSTAAATAHPGSGASVARTVAAAAGDPCVGNMPKNIFDQVAGEYVKIHDRSLPPGVYSQEFVEQRAAKITRWISDGYTGKEFCYLDFGCGNGRLFNMLIETHSLKPLVEQGRLRLFGFDTSTASLEEAKRIAGNERVCFASDWDDLPPDVRFDLVSGCSVFHHIVPAERSTVAETLRRRMKPKARLAIWEHNPFNPVTRLLVSICPFDKDARLLTFSATRTLFEANSYRYVQHAYVNVFPPRWQQAGLLAAIEKKLERVPVGSQYWAMFESHE
jgi:SAM-dependent methyltransferase